jgi:integrase/recombinase XerD
MTPKAREALDGYLEHEREKRSGALFQSRTGRRLPRTTVQDVPAAIRNQTNSQLPEDERFTFPPHTLRHTFLREMARKHGVEFALEQSGHTSGRYIWRYVQPSDDARQQAVDELF